MKRDRLLRTILIPLVAAVVGAVALGGCATYHQHRYIDSGGYFSRAGGYSGAAVYSNTSHAAHSATNPAVYPYYSIDYFYFSRHYHPYSVYVGYREPLYYPYPGWALGYHRPRHSRYSAGYGFGYPWHGFEHRFPRFSLGFFASHSVHHRFAHRGVGHHHPIRQIDQRLGELQHRRVEAPRRTLLGRTNGRSAIVSSGPSGAPRDAASPRSGRAEIARQQLLQARDSRSQRRRVRRESRADSRIVFRQEQRRTEMRRDSRRSDENEERVGRERPAARRIPSGNLRGRVIANRNGATTRGGQSRDDDSRRRDAMRRPERAGGTRSFRRQQRDSSAGRVRRAAEPAPDVSRSRGSLTPRAGRVPDRDVRKTKPKRQRRAASRPTRAQLPPAERKPRDTLRRSGARDGDRTSSRRDRLRSRRDGGRLR